MGEAQVVGRLKAVLVGKAVPYARPGAFSAIDKQAVSGRVEVCAEGLAGDEQGDRRVHGGPDKAVHCYAWSHYAGWRAELPGSPLWREPGAFGENFSVEGIDESSVSIAEQWRAGSAVFELSQGRQPCWKLNERFGVADMSKRVQDSLRAGWYLRVLSPGTVGAGDEIVRIACPWPEWTVERLLRIIRDRECEPALLRQVLELPLPASWLKLFRGRLESGQTESWAGRLFG
ncbi:MAG TPA: MOSC domain-containing protein [Burkholderiaceae bacterium]|nr:MOSC domain-containing protein [Burkholderiaceae bacterium]